jgi:hypothetical protein
MKSEKEKQRNVVEMNVIASGGDLKGLESGLERRLEKLSNGMFDEGSKKEKKRKNCRLNSDKEVASLF